MNIKLILFISIVPVLSQGCDKTDKMTGRTYSLVDSDMGYVKVDSVSSCLVEGMDTLIDSDMVAMFLSSSATLERGADVLYGLNRDSEEYLKAQWSEADRIRDLGESIVAIPSIDIVLRSDQECAWISLINAEPMTRGVVYIDESSVFGSETFVSLPPLPLVFEASRQYRDR